MHMVEVPMEYAIIVYQLTGSDVKERRRTNSASDDYPTLAIEVVNKIAAMSPPTSKKDTQAFLGTMGFWRMHIPDYSQIVNPLYHV